MGSNQEEVLNVLLPVMADAKSNMEVASISFAQFQIEFIILLS